MELPGVSFSHQSKFVSFQCFCIIVVLLVLPYSAQCSEKSSQTAICINIPSKYIIFCKKLSANPIYNRKFMNKNLQLKLQLFPAYNARMLSYTEWIRPKKWKNCAKQIIKLYLHFHILLNFFWAWQNTKYITTILHTFRLKYFCGISILYFFFFSTRRRHKYRLCLQVFPISSFVYP